MNNLHWNAAGLMSWSIALKESFCECISCYVVISMYYNVQKLKQYTNIDIILISMIYLPESNLIMIFLNR